jgi:hypothetical protein
MAHPSQSQDVEHKGTKPNPLASRQRQSGDRSEKVAQKQLDREAEAGPEQQEEDNSQLSQHGTNTPSRPD